MGMRDRISADTKAELRDYWIKMLLLLMGAFGLLVVISALSGDSAQECPAETLCTQRDMEGWLGVDLPLTAEGIRFRSDPGSVDLWLTFSASPLEVTQFLSRLGLETGNGVVPEVRPEWWPDDPALASYASDARPNRIYTVLVDQADGARWTLYLYGVAAQ